MAKIVVAEATVPPFPSCYRRDLEATRTDAAYRTMSGRNARHGKQGPGPEMRFILRLFGWLFAAGAIVFVIGAVGAAGFIWHYSKDLPDSAQLRNYEPPVMTRVHAGDGSLIAEFARERRLYLPIQAVPEAGHRRLLSAEDKNFYKHPGVDPEGIVRAAITNFRNRGAGRRPQGASTITQQVAKNFLVGSEQHARAQDPRGAARAAHRGDLSKDKILELYLNEIYLGAPAPGRAAMASPPRR